MNPRVGFGLVILAIFCGCGGPKQSKALRNSGFASSDYRPKLFVTETARLNDVLAQYRYLLEVSALESLAERLRMLLAELQFIVEIKGLGTFKKKYRNPFQIVADSSAADLVLTVRIEELAFTQHEVSKVDQTLRLLASGPLIQPRTFPNDVIELSCPLRDKSTGRTVYAFSVRVKQGKSLFGEASFERLMEQACNKLLDKLLAN